jgi:AcrR family transcriptional regulator
MPVVLAVQTEDVWERRRRLMRRDIESVALELYAEHGYEVVGVEQIAAAAGISERTFFRYFPTKDAVLLAMPVRILASLCAAFEARPADEPLLEAWRAVATSEGHWDAEDVRVALLFRSALTRSPDLGQRIHGHPALRKRFRQAVAARLLVDPADLRAGVVAAAVQGAMEAALDRWAEQDHERELADVFAASFDILGDLEGSAVSRRSG